MSSTPPHREAAHSRTPRCRVAGSTLPEVLVVDDDKFILELVRLHLANAGHAVTTAEDAMVAMRHLMRRAPRLIILDIQMPYMDGFEFLNALRSDAAY